MLKIQTENLEKQFKKKNKTCHKKRRKRKCTKKIKSVQCNSKKM